MGMATRKQTTLQRDLYDNHMFFARARISGLQHSALRFIHASKLAER